MKLNKKGFTLTELLATIGILVIMSLLIGVNLNSILKSTQKKNDDEEKIRIQKAACVYVDSAINTGNLCKGTSGTCTAITVKMLADKELLDESFKSNTNTIKVCYKDGEKICEYKCTKDCKC